MITKGVCVCTILISEKKKFFGVKFPVRNFGVLGLDWRDRERWGMFFSVAIFKAINKIFASFLKYPSHTVDPSVGWK